MEKTTVREAFPEPSPDFGERVEAARRDLARATGALWSIISETLDAARARPWEWVPAAFGETSPTKRDHAERAAVMDLAARLRMSEVSVRTLGAVAGRASRRLPSLWSALVSAGTVSGPHVRAALEVSEHLDDDACREFDARILPLALDLPPARLRVRAKVIAERLQRRSLERRHEDAVQGRRVWVEQVDDGMAWLHAHLPAETAHRAARRIDAAAAELASHDGEDRTRDQLRADVVGDLLTGDGTPHAVKSVVQVEVPVHSLLGRSDRPATLDGTVPVDPAVARRICSEASVLFRMLTDPVTSAVLDLDRRSYRPSADLARFVRARDRVCVLPGCSRSAARCELDHTVPYPCGTTSAGNLAPLCVSHHHGKHESLWTVEGTDGQLLWTSPTGFVMGPEPPDPPDPPPALDLPELPPF